MTSSKFSQNKAFDIRRTRSIKNNSFKQTSLNKALSANILCQKSNQIQNGNKNNKTHQHKS